MSRAVTLLLLCVYVCRRRRRRFTPSPSSLAASRSLCVRRLGLWPLLEELLPLELPLVDLRAVL